MKDERKQKIREFKTILKESQDTITELVSSLIKEEDEEKKKEVREKIAVEKSNMQDTKKSLELIKMNKNMSSHFQWLPHVGMNRQQARRFRKLRRI